MDELYLENPELYRNFTWMVRELFDEIVQAVAPNIEKKITYWWKPIDLSTRVAIILYFLATGNSYKSLQYSIRVAHNTITSIVPETCDAIVSAFGHDVLCLPDTQQKWKQVAKKFAER